MVLAASERLSLAVSQSAGVHAYSFLSVYILLTQRERKRERKVIWNRISHASSREFSISGGHVAKITVF